MSLRSELDELRERIDSLEEQFDQDGVDAADAVVEVDLSSVETRLDKLKTQCANGFDAAGARNHDLLGQMARMRSALDSLHADLRQPKEAMQSAASQLVSAMGQFTQTLNDRVTIAKGVRGFVLPDQELNGALRPVLNDIANAIERKTL